MSEFGCIDHLPRNFGEIEALYSNKMTPVYSGGFVYEYTQEANKYGLVQVQGDSVQELPDFAVLQSALARTPAPTDDGGYKINGKPSNCPPKTNTWLVRNTSIPIMPSQAEKYFKNGAGAGVGIKPGDKGSQWAGKPSSGWADAKNGDAMDKPKSHGSVNSPLSVFLMLSATVAIAGLVT
jgi:1,3-beta-glucanosyltransferase GAS5